MGKIKFEFQYKNSVINIPGSAVGQMKDATAVDFKTLFALAASGGTADTDELCERVGAGPDEITEAVNYWISAGVLTVENKTDGAVRTEHISSNGNRVVVVQGGGQTHYTGEEIERIFSENTNLKEFIDECQRILGKMLSVPEINRIVSLTDIYRLSCEFLLLLVGRCAEKGHGSVPYIAKTAISLYNDGVITVEGLEERIRIEDENCQVEAIVKKMFGIERALTAKEKRFIGEWAAMKISEDMLKLAYDKTVDNTGEPSMPYINKLLTNWKEAGYKSAEDVAAADERYKAEKAGKEQKKGSSFDQDKFFDAAIRHSMESHGKQ